MKAVILAGGKATRLMPLTCNIPKAIVPVLNIPFLEHVIRHLRQHHIKDIILAQGHLSQPIADCLGDGSRLGVRLTCIVEDSPLGTAGAIKNAGKHLDDTFLVLNGDIFTDLDITAMLDFHHQRKAKATIALAPVDDPTSYGLVETNNEGRITRFREKPKPKEVTTRMINAGTYVLEPEILALIPPKKQASMERETFQQLLAQKAPVYAFSSSAYWLDMGTPEKYLQLHRDLLRGKRVVIGEPNDIHPTAKITGPAIIGANCSIGPQVKLIGPVVIGTGCTIAAGSVIEDSVIWSNTLIGTGVHLQSSILGDGCCFNAGCVCQGAVVGDYVTVLSGGKLEPGSKIQAGTTVEP